MQDLRNFLAVLEQRGDMARIKREVDPIHEVAAVMKRSSELGGPALLFENVRGSKIRLAGNVVAGRQRVATALGTTTDELLETYRQRLRAPIAPVKVNEPGQTETISGLSALPIIKLSERDAGRYITAGVIFAAHPDTGKINLSFQRMCPVSDDAVAIFAGETSDLYTYLMAAKGKPLPVAVATGLHPAFFWWRGQDSQPKRRKSRWPAGCLESRYGSTKAYTANGSFRKPLKSFSRARSIFNIRCRKDRLANTQDTTARARCSRGNLRSCASSL